MHLFCFNTGTVASSRNTVLDVIKSVMCKPVIQELVNVETTGDAMTNLYNFLPPTVYNQEDQLQLLSQSDSQINLKSTIVETVIPTFKQSILYVYVDSRNAFVKTKKNNKQKLRMESFAKMTRFDATATLTAMDLSKNTV